MIRNNLAILMSERGIRNSYLSAKTGISKNTISATSSNDGKMIQLETINKICQVLQVEPGQFFSYLPFDLEIKVFCDNLIYDEENVGVDEIGLPVKQPVINELFLDVYVSKVYLNGSKDFSLSGSLVSPVNLYGSVPPIIHIGGSDNDSLEFSKLWASIPKPFQSDIEKVLKSKIFDEIYGILSGKNQDYDFSKWHFDIEFYADTYLNDLEVKFF
ncbi:helix-turn-helix domain-containing protein [Enterococcus italicus]